MCRKESQFSQLRLITFTQHSGTRAQIDPYLRAFVALTHLSTRRSHMMAHATSAVKRFVLAQMVAITQVWAGTTIRQEPADASRRTGPELFVASDPLTKINRRTNTSNSMLATWMDHCRVESEISPRLMRTRRQTLIKRQMSVSQCIK